MDQYFASYEELDVHQLMLNDKVRTRAYKNAIFNSKEKFKDKIVMDVGAGTGILSIFCAQVGAKKVFAVEANGLASTITKEVVAENKLEDKIEVIHSKVEDLDPDKIGKVDIIVSEWMGFYLMHEGMMESFLLAKDRFLVKDGLLFPHVATLYAAPCQLPSMYEFWDDVEGVSMKCVGKKLRETKTKKPEVLIVRKEDLLGNEKIVARWVLSFRISPDELDAIGYEELLSVCKKDGKYQGICLWFSVQFPDGSVLSTGPMDEVTHWKQTAIVLPSEIDVVKDEPIAFKLRLLRDPLKPRQYNVELELLDAAEVQHDVMCGCHMTKCIVIRRFLEEHPDGSEESDPEET